MLPTDHRTVMSMTQELTPEPDWAGIACGIQRRLVGKLAAPRDWIEDAIQDALVCMVVLARRGESIGSYIAFGVEFAKRRWVDDLRKSRRRGRPYEVDPDEYEASSERESAITDWATLLRQAGSDPTRAWCRILTAIAGGAKGTRKIATVLGNDVKSVRKTRRRLQAWLQRILAPSPPPLTTTVTGCPSVGGLQFPETALDQTNSMP